MRERSISIWSGGLIVLLGLVAPAVAGSVTWVPEEFGYMQYSFDGTEESSGESVRGSFKFITSFSSAEDNQNNWLDFQTCTEFTPGTFCLDTDRYLLAEAHLVFGDGRFVNFYQTGTLPDTLTYTLNGGFGRGTEYWSPPHSPTVGFFLDVDMSHLSRGLYSHDVFMAELLRDDVISMHGGFSCAAAGSLGYYEGGRGNCGPSDLYADPNGYAFGSYAGKLTREVPEPGTLALLGFSLIGVLAGSARRREKFPAKRS
jgi:PEP-CTERM motif